MKNHLDCGCLLYDPARQKVKSGAAPRPEAPLFTFCRRDRRAGTRSPGGSSPTAPLLPAVHAAEGLLVKNHLDCGRLLYDPARQKVKRRFRVGVLRRRWGPPAWWPQRPAQHPDPEAPLFTFCRAGS